MKSPFFSIVIPTKNRSILVNLAIQSVLRQSFEDFELIVADNDDTSATQGVVESFSDDRIKYHRTGDLSMADNWDLGCSQASGKYLCLLEDKQVFKYGTLERVYNEIRRTGAKIIRWQSESFSPYGIAYRIRRARGSGDVKELSADEILNCFLSSRYSNAKRILPLPHFGCVSMDIVRQIRNNSLQRLCVPVSPDYNLAFAQLAYCDRVLIIEDGLVVFSDAKQSTGLSVRLKGAVGNQFAELHDDAMFDLVPVKVSTVSGSIFNDYLHIQSKIGGKLLDFPVNWGNYFIEIHACIESSKKLGIDMREEQTEWARALGAQPSVIQNDVKMKLNKIKKYGKAMEKLESYSQSNWIKYFERFIKSIYYCKIKKATLWQFNNVMEYLDWEFAQNEY
jgi:glycosyltransferase involved in cell wall biosynthesis